ncbi:MAG: hypothetical protein QNJ45_25870, partial [Ardenticatenaceae bacterium]|nr:hypothetical protein [Ardenticatenaceae bacterium]
GHLDLLVFLGIFWFHLFTSVQDCTEVIHLHNIWHSLNIISKVCLKTPEKRWLSLSKPKRLTK